MRSQSVRRLALLFRKLAHTRHLLPERMEYVIVGLIYEERLAVGILARFIRCFERSFVEHSRLKFLNGAKVLRQRGPKSMVGGVTARC